MEVKNKKITESTSITGDDSGIHYDVDFYTHMSGLGVTDPQKHYVDLWQFYNPLEGWKPDKICEIINILSKIRFFNRFSEENLLLMLKRVTLKKLPKN